MADNETIADVLAAMRDEGRTGESSCLEWVGAKMRDYADRIEAAHKREVEATAAKCCQLGRLAGYGASEIKHQQEPVGDAAKLREAAEYAVAEVSHFIGRVGDYDDWLAGVVAKCRAALDAPLRNCDRPECATSKAAQDVWRKEDGGKTAYYEWLLAPATDNEGGAKCKK